MSSVIPLGKLETVGLTTAWPDEARNFTPWLADDPNLAMLGEALGIQLEHEATEKAVGPFAADILAREAGTDRWVLIENQLTRTDHTHLGQLLTYAAGLDARIIVWIAENFREQHRAAIDFLNHATREEFSFFGVRVELLRIGESSFAPNFSVVAKPNNWSKEAQAAKQIAQDTLSPTQLVNREFWSEVIGSSTERYPALAGKTPYKSSWQSAERIRSAPNFYAECNASFTATSQLRVEVYLGGILAKAVFQILQARRREIENSFGNELTWEELPTRQDSRVAFYMPMPQKRDDKTAWPSQRARLLDHWKKLADVFRGPINAIDLNALAQVDEEVEG
jgi:Domain of unknown function (DUF4268)